jgi:GT2 family glycosyltransferase
VARALTNPVASAALTHDTSAVTVVIPTRDRAGSILLPLRKLLENQRLFEVRIVDQSEGDATEKSVAPFRADPRVRYARTTSKGLSAALNEGICGATTEFVAITGDDCEVEATWLEALVAAFRVDPHAGVIFGNVVPGPHDRAVGFVPASVRSRPVLVRTVRDKYRLSGTSACMALRRTVWQALQGFDEMLGLGAPLRAGEETDFVIRALLAGHFVYETPDAAVVHHGLIPWNQRMPLIERNWYGTGAAFAKALKRGRPETVLALAKVAWSWASRRSRVAASLGDGPYRSACLAAFTRGFAAGSLILIDPTSGHFRRPHPDSSDAGQQHAG